MKMKQGCIKSGILSKYSIWRLYNKLGSNIMVYNNRWIGNNMTLLQVTKPVSFSFSGFQTTSVRIIEEILYSSKQWIAIRERHIQTIFRLFQP